MAVAKIVTGHFQFGALERGKTLSKEPAYYAMYTFKHRKCIDRSRFLVLESYNRRA
jgi:hypothetical protein